MLSKFSFFKALFCRFTLSTNNSFQCIYIGVPKVPYSISFVSTRYNLNYKTLLWPSAPTPLLPSLPDVLPRFRSPRLLYGGLLTAEGDILVDESPAVAQQQGLSIIQNHHCICSDLFFRNGLHVIFSQSGLVLTWLLVDRALSYTLQVTNGWLAGLTPLGLFWVVWTCVFWRYLPKIADVHMADPNAPAGRERARTRPRLRPGNQKPGYCPQGRSLTLRITEIYFLISGLDFLFFVARLKFERSRKGVRGLEYVRNCMCSDTFYQALYSCVQQALAAT